MATKAQVRKAVAAVGGNWDERYDTFDSPNGYVWQASNCHSIKAVYDDFQTMPQNYDGFLEQIELGVWECTDPECEMCE